MFRERRVQAGGWLLFLECLVGTQTGSSHLVPHFSHESQGPEKLGNLQSPSAWRARSWHSDVCPEALVLAQPSAANSTTTHLGDCQ